MEQIFRLAASLPRLELLAGNERLKKEQVL
jgi:hypothetical protein